MRVLCFLAVLVAFAIASTEEKELRCSFCRFAVFQMQESQQQIPKNAICDFFTETEHKEKCENFMESNIVSLFRTAVEEGQTMEDTCSTHNHCDAEAEESGVEVADFSTGAGPGGCGICKFLVGIIEKWLAAKATEQEILKILEDGCKLLSLFGGSVVKDCDAIVKAYGSELIQLLLKKEPPTTVCSQVGLCKATYEHALIDRDDAIGEVTEVQPFDHEGEEVDVRLPYKPVDYFEGYLFKCTLCKGAIGFLESVVGSNDTKAYFIAEMHKFCEHLKFSFLKKACHNFTDNQLSHVIDKVIEDEPPSAVCDAVNYCTSPEPADAPMDRSRILTASGLVVHKPLAKLRPEAGFCDICLFIVGSLESLIDNNSTIQDIEKLLDGVCKLLPSNDQGLCTSLINQYLPALIQFVINKEPPKVACGQLGVCKKSALPWEEPVSTHNELPPRLRAGHKIRQRHHHGK